MFVFNFCLVLFLIFISFSVSKSVDGALHVGSSACVDPLQCYLNSLIIYLPPSICQDYLGKQLCLNGLTVYGIYLSLIPSAYDSPTTLMFGMSDVGTIVKGTYTYGIAGGKINAIVNNTYFTTDLYVD